MPDNQETPVADPSKAHFDELLLRMRGLTHAVIKQDKDVKTNAAAITELREVVDKSMTLVETLVDEIKTQVAHTEAYRKEAELLRDKVASFEQLYDPKTLHERTGAIVEYLENLVRDLQDATDKDKGANIVAFNAENEYDRGTVGWNLKVILKALAMEPVFFNLGAPFEIQVAESITVAQTNIKLINPKNLLGGAVHTIIGGDLHDMLLISARGHAVLVTDTGNLKLSSDYEMDGGSVIALRKTKTNWVEVWRSN